MPPHRVDVIHKACIGLTAGHRECRHTVAKGLFVRTAKGAAETAAAPVTSSRPGAFPKASIRCWGKPPNEGTWLRRVQGYPSPCHAVYASPRSSLRPLLCRRPSRTRPRRHFGGQTHRAIRWCARYGRPADSLDARASAPLRVSAPRSGATGLITARPRVR